MNAMMQSFRSIIRALQGAIGEAASKINPAPILLVAAFNHLNRTAQRLQTLFDRWQAGTLPALRPSRPGRKQTPRPRLRFPGKFGWLGIAAGHQARGNASQLQHLINQPEFVTFVTEVPRAARLMRPIRTMLGIQTVPAAIGAIVYDKPPRPRRQAPQALPAPALPNFESRTGQRQPFARLPNHIYREG